MSVIELDKHVAALLEEKYGLLVEQGSYYMCDKIEIESPANYLIL